MKKIVNIHSFLLLAALFLLGSCSKSFVNKTPADSVPTQEALTTLSAMQSALNGIYAEIRNVGQYGRDFPVLGDLQGDNTFVESRNSGRYIPQYSYTVAVTDQVPNDDWAESYTGILRANLIIDDTVTTTGVAQVKAQAYALRAILYFKLINIFATPYTTAPSAMGVPLVLHYDVAALPSRSSVGDVYTQIISDLTTAFQNGPAYSSSVFLSKYAAEALLARAYLYEGDYVHAQAAAEDVISNSTFTLVSPANFGNFWANPALKTDKVEVLFEVDADPINNNGFDDLGGIYINGYQDIYCSSQLAALYSATDVRAGLLIAGTTKSGANAWLVNKYPNAQNTDRDNLKVIRLAEVYLIAAEAAARQGQTTVAQQHLNDLMLQRDPAFAGYNDTGSTLIDDIVQERRKELAFEGDRLYDLNRLGLPVNRIVNAGATPAGTGNSNLNIPYPDFRRLAPIPQQEILANPSIAKQQNPGY